MGEGAKIRFGIGKYVSEFAKKQLIDDHRSPLTAMPNRILCRAYTVAGGPRRAGTSTFFGSQTLEIGMRRRGLGCS